MSKKLHRTVIALVATFLAAAASLLLLSAWAIAPHSLRPGDVVRTAGHIVRAPMAQRLVIGDSRTYLAPQPGGALFAGYGGATFASLERVTGVLCALHDGPVTIAIGVNDAKRNGFDVQASRDAMTRLSGHCGDRDVTFVAIWPVESGREPHGSRLDPEAVAMLNRMIAEEAEAHGAILILAPALEPGFTHDGVHFTDPVSEIYARYLVGERLQVR